LNGDTRFDLYPDFKLPWSAAVVRTLKSNLNPTYVSAAQSASGKPELIVNPTYRIESRVVALDGFYDLATLVNKNSEVDMTAATQALVQQLAVKFGSTVIQAVMENLIKDQAEKSIQKKVADFLATYVGQEIAGQIISTVVQVVNIYGWIELAFNVVDYFEIRDSVDDIEDCVQEYVTADFNRGISDVLFPYAIGSISTPVVQTGTSQQRTYILPNATESKAVMRRLLARRGTGSYGCGALLNNDPAAALWSYLVSFTLGILILEDQERGCMTAINVAVLAPMQM
jgi:hypothetical protein